jgi:palmitoyl transferase
MKIAQLFLYFIIISTHVFAAEPPSPACHKWPAWFKPICTQLYDTWTKGYLEVFATGYAWHNRYVYSEERLKTYNEVAWGGGFGRGYDDKEGDWNTLYVIAFLDSHKNVEPMAGYAFIKTAHFTESIRAGIGYTLFVTMRPDIFKGRPFPGALPVVSVSFRRLTLFATYIPGAQSAGNVLFCFAKYAFNGF